MCLKAQHPTKSPTTRKYVSDGASWRNGRFYLFTTGHASLKIHFKATASTHTQKQRDTHADWLNTFLTDDAISVYFKKLHRDENEVLVYHCADVPVLRQTWVTSKWSMQLYRTINYCRLFGD